MDRLRRQFDEMQLITEIDLSKMEQWRSIGASVGRLDIVDEIKNAYKQASFPIIDQIREAVQTGQNQDLKKHFHKMKSGCGNVGFIRLQRMCEFSEAFLEEDSYSPEEVKYIFDHIDEEFKKSLVILETL